MAREENASISGQTPSDATLVGFWSYVRQDDLAEEGRIARLAQRIRAEYTLITGADLRVFIDRDDIKWGEEWQRRIDQALAGTAFFIPVVTPRYFQSEACRGELFTFAGHAESLGITELLLPLLYVDVPGLRDEDQDDNAIRLIARTQYEDWRDLRLEDERSSTYRHAVHRLAQRLADINAQLAERSRSVIVAQPVKDDSEEPGFIDVLAAGEAAAPELTTTLTEMTSLLDQLGSATNEATEDMTKSDRMGRGSGGRVLVARKLAARLEPLSTRMLTLGQQYAAHLVDVDAGILALIRRIEEQDMSGEERTQACAFLDTIRAMARAGRQSASAFKELVASLAQGEQLSRDLRAPLRRLRDGVKQVMDGQKIIDEWERRADAVGLDCPDETESASTPAPV